MKVSFWGVRGSIPKPYTSVELKEKIRLAFLASHKLTFSTISELDSFIETLPNIANENIGGNTSCVEVNCGDEVIILDAGSGLKNLGYKLMRDFKAWSNINFLDSESYEDILQAAVLKGKSKTITKEKEPINISLFLSHIHWDHIMGFPFFVPAYLPTSTINIYGFDKKALEEVFVVQQFAPKLFPVPFNKLAAKINFYSFEKKPLKIANIEVENFLLPHPGFSLAYKIKCNNKILVYATDYEFVDDKLSLNKFIEFVSGADVFISDAQYTYLESVTREGWGHSTSFQAVDIALEAGVKNLYLYHHDPDHSDKKMYDILKTTRQYYQTIKKKEELNIQLAVEEKTINI